MSVPAIALYTSPPQIPSSQDYDFSSRPTSVTASSPSSSKPMAIGGLSCLFSSSSSPSALRHQAATAITGDELNSPWHDRSDEHLCSSFSYSSSALKCREQSPVSVFQGPGVSSRSPPSLRIPRDWNWVDHRSGRDRLFNGFVRNALGSCLDYEAPPSFVGGGEDVEEELTFNLDDGLPEAGQSGESYGKELLAGAQVRHKIFEEEVILKAFHEAEKAHRGQMRASGDPYLQHCVETAVLLAEIGANSTVVAAGLLHDTIDDSFMNYDHISQMFGKGVADLVQGVSKLSHLSKLARENNTANKTAEADRLHTLFLAMADARAVLIKLADRLHNMMTLDALPLFKQQRFAKETLEIFAPLANRLGIATWKEQLENLCFKYVYPEAHKRLSSELLKSYDEAMIASAIEKLEQALKDEGVSNHVLCGRYKSLYSVYCKMQKKNLMMDEIHDIHGLRLIVDKEEDCYKALNIVHRIWSNVDGRFKDYIAHPKFNGYQSLHTVVLSKNEVPLEVQIRTKQMHLQAEYGFAAHWLYKEGDSEHSSFILQMVKWARWVLTWQCETMNNERLTSLNDSDSVRPQCPFPSHSDDCPYSYTRQCKHDGPIYIIMLENEKMSVQEFPANSTVNDLLERARRGSSRWNSYGFPFKEDLRPRFNHQPVSDPNQKLKMGDVIELTPSIPDKSLPVYREEIQRMYDRGHTPRLVVAGRSSSSGWRN